MQRKAFILALALVGGAAQAAEEAAMKFHGTLRAPPPCTINDGGIVETDFGQRVGINKVDGVNYRQAVAYRLSCNLNDALPWELTLTLKGNATAFDKAALQTDKTDLGIRLYRNDEPFVINSSLNIDPANPPRLEAVPVARPGAALSEGAFSATATLQADYQ
ncbi:putative minor fimbrial subunit StfF [Acinetobacter baumannii]|uniref:fimbrial protein n=1 Tax=Serratia ureilytica TaxID=300181 RepID=UPI000B8EC23E|nr:fimbrial protein [Serratia ureilytica]MEB5996074.1 fimbrial protein [Serratia ureilytica]SVK46182.1 putative minor fimbrial subunit StfF [Acinetobacter baumannii]